MKKVTNEQKKMIEEALGFHSEIELEEASWTVEEESENFITFELDGYNVSIEIFKNNPDTHRIYDPYHQVYAGVVGDDGWTCWGNDLDKYSTTDQRETLVKMWQMGMDDDIKAKLEDSVLLTQDQLSSIGFDDEWLKEMKIDEAWLELVTDDDIFFILGSSPRETDICSKDWNPIVTLDLFEDIMREGILK